MLRAKVSRALIEENRNSSGVDRAKVRFSVAVKIGDGQSLRTSRKMRKKSICISKLCQGDYRCKAEYRHHP